MSEFVAGDRVYQARVGTYVDTFTSDGQQWAGVHWDGTETTDQTDSTTIKRLNDLPRLIRETIADSPLVLSESCPSAPDTREIVAKLASAARVVLAHARGADDDECVVDNRALDDLDKALTQWDALAARINGNRATEEPR